MKTNKKGRMTNQERDRVKNDALGLFLRGYSLQSISEMETIQVGVASLRKWAKEGDWEERKKLENISPSEIKDMILKNVAAIKSGRQMPYPPDSISKLASAWEKMDDPRKRAFYTMEAFMGFAQWLIDKAFTLKGNKRKQIIELLKTVRELQDEYLTTLLDY